jgi:catechol 2,3-dioxygenase-like lactoylglutathione lyase family enzyme
MRIEKISAVTLKVASMRTSVRFYKDVLGMEIIYGGEDGSFSSLRAKDANTPILNLNWTPITGPFRDSEHFPATPCHSLIHP